jgi:thioesterase domain-containing protein/acyl carrier protein
METQVHALWAQALQLDPQRLGCHDDFFDLGGTSLGLIRMASLIAKHFGAELSVEDLFRHRTVAEVAVLLERQRSEAAPSPLTCFGEGRPQILFCVPGINGHALGFKNLAHALTDHALYCLEPIDIRARQLVALDSMEAMCAGYLQAIRQAQPHGPYKLAGHSSGGLVALQLASMLEREGEQVAGVVLLDSYAGFEGENLQWMLERPKMEALGAPYVNHIFAAFERFLGHDFGLAVADLGRMGEEERLMHVAEQLARHDIIAQADPVFVRHYLQLRKRHESMVTAYYVGPERPPFRGEVTLVRAAEVLAQQGDRLRPDYGWGEHLPQGVSLLTSPGHHESLITGPNAPALAQALEMLFADRVVVEPAQAPELVVA